MNDANDPDIGAVPADQRPGVDNEAHEWRLQDTDYPSTFGYHEHRERVAHLEQSWHQSRLYRAAKLVRVSNAKTCVDLGCGDGGLLSVLRNQYGIESWGYDFCPANMAGWTERGVHAEFRDVFNDRPTDLRWGECAVVTEVLEHLQDPHSAVAWIAEHSQFIVASSPWGERPGGICDSHIWAWDMIGYRDMIGKYFDVLDHRQVDWSQVLLGKRKS